MAKLPLSCYQVPWFRLTKLLLTIIRLVLFALYLFFLSNPSGSNSQSGPPTPLFIIVFFYNIRVCLAVAVVGFFLAILCLLCLGCMCEMFRNYQRLSEWQKFKLVFTGSTFCFSKYDTTSEQWIPILFKMIVTISYSVIAIFWKYSDWFCCSRYRYAAFIFDAVHYGLFMILTVVIFGLDIGLYLPDAADKSAFKNAIIVFSMYTLVFAIHLAIEIYRLIQTRRIDSRIRHIFKGEENVTKKAKAMFSDESCDLVCMNPRCQSLDPEHCIKAHAVNHIFRASKRDVPYGTRNENFAIGFHYTSIDAVKNIIRSFMLPSKNGWFGQGIYFANNLDATTWKSRNKGGAFICAKLDLGRIKIVQETAPEHKLITPQSLAAEGFDSVYYEDPRGPTYDEFTVPNSDCIIEYVVMITSEAIANYQESI